MKKSKLSLILCISCVLLFASCAKKVVIPFQSETLNTGSIKLKPSTSIKSASVTMDGSLIWDKKKRVKSVTITNVPQGSHDVNVVSASWYYKEALNHKETVELKSGENKTMLISVPPYSTGYYFYMTGVIIVCIAVAWLPLL